ncbi:MAG: hypothetical protein HY073_04295 [Deltaproteobacteria bacterium]|nr:hypothetical protein [Deltaproteobacteria bacterium]
MTPLIYTSMTVGLLLGGLNFWLLSRVIAGLTRSHQVSTWKTAFFFFGKMTVLFVTIGLILWKSYVSPLPFVVGFSLGLIGGIAIILIKGRKIQDA